MYLITRTSTSPASPIHIFVEQSQGDGDAGLAAGGSFTFFPAGSQEGPNSFQVSEHAARAIMDDPGVAVHFECSPELPRKDARPAALAADQDVRARARSKARPEGET